MAQNIIKIAYFDAGSGIAGDMTVAALIDAGKLSVDDLKDALGALELSDYDISAPEVAVDEVRCRGFRVEFDDSAHADRNWAVIRPMIERAGKRGLSTGTVERALAIFTLLARAEAKAHGIELERVHFHEVGAVDSIVDIVGTAWCLDRLGVDACFCGPVPSGSGYVDTEHGRLPVPTPATAELLRGLDVVAGDGKGELVTPTGAAILSALAKPLRPGLRVQSVGYGAGTKRFEDRPNFLRVFLGEADSVSDEDVYAIEADIDDMTAAALSHATERLRKAGARDVAVSPLTMKKGRLGSRVSVLCDLGKLHDLARELLSSTTTIGVRYRRWARTVLPRRIEVVETRYGPVAVKIVRRPDGRETAEPEFDDVAAASERAGASFADVRQAALDAHTAKA